MNFRVQGVVVPLLTPYDGRGDFDAVKLRPLVDFLIERGVHGFFPGGSTGEGPLLSNDERRACCEAVVEAAAGRVPVIMQTGATTTVETLALTRHARESGAAAAALIAPYYYTHADETLIRHFCTVADAVPDFPIYLYNYPAVSSNSLSPALAAAVAERCPNVVGIKDSSGVLGNLVAYSRLRSGRFNTFSGSDGQALAALAVGADGCVSGNANVVPEIVVALYAAAAAGDLAAARRMQARLDRARQIMGDGGHLALFKGLLAHRGVELGDVRAPLPPAGPALIEERWAALEALLAEPHGA